uniref:NnrS family protein n=1 Tax=Immundisolibacter sp. TaxID=1934948 RepID=UPI00356826A3
MLPASNTSESSCVHPLFRLGFRPFFLGGAGFALLAVGLWAAAYLGFVSGFAPRGGWLAWHMHEMPFGFVTAVIAGFLLTAVQAWTGTPGLRGWPLMGLFGLWLAARVAWLWPGLPWLVLVAIELAFLPAVAMRLGWQLWRVNQWRNYPLVGLLLLLALADVAILHALAAGDFDLLRRAVWAALWLIGTIIAVVGGRVIPFFTQGGLRLSAPIVPRRSLEIFAYGGLPVLALL